MSFMSNNPPFFQQALQDTADLLERVSDRLSTASSEIFTFSNQTQTLLGGIVAESNDRLEGLASQIYQISLGYKKLSDA